MSDYRIVKAEVEATFYLTNSTVLRGTVFVAEFAGTHTGRQTLGDLMVETTAMLPLVDRRGQFVLVGISGIVAAEVDRKSASLPPLVVNVPVHIDAAGGHRFDGTLLLDQGAGDRLSDVLNSAVEWIPMETAAGIAWMSRRHIVTARPRS